MVDAAQYRHDVSLIRKKIRIALYTEAEVAMMMTEHTKTPCEKTLSVVSTV